MSNQGVGSCMGTKVTIKVVGILRRRIKVGRREMVSGIIEMAGQWRESEYDRMGDIYLTIEGLTYMYHPKE